MTPRQVETLRELRARRIKYLVVGGQAMRAHGIARITRDLDLWVARDAGNAKLMKLLLEDFGHQLPLERLQEPNLKLTIGDPKMPDVDILTSVAGDPPFEECFARAQRLMLDTRRVPVIALDDLINIKIASADAMDVDAANTQLEVAARKAAELTAVKERRDVELLRLFT